MVPKSSGVKLPQAAVMKVRIVKVIVSPEVRNLSDPAAAVDQHFLESAILGAKGIAVTQMPFPEDRGAVAVVGEDLRHHHFGSARHVAAHDGMPDARARRVTPGHQCRSRGRAGGIRVKVGQPNALLI